MHASAYNLIQGFATRLVGDESVCDVGSYDVNGTLKPIFSKQQYTGTDIAKGPNVDVVCEAESLPFYNEKFDVVVSANCLEHVANPFQWAREVARILRVGGWLAIQTPAMIHYHNPPHYWQVRKDGMRLLFKDLIEIELCEEFGMDTFLIGKKVI